MGALLLALTLAWPAAAGLPKRPSADRIGDYAAVLTPKGRARLRAIADDLDRHTGAELAVATVRSLDGRDVADYANRLFRAWGVGKKDKDNGILILLCPSERKSRIEVGYGLEPWLTDAEAGRILKDEMRPAFQAGRFEEGLLIGASRIGAALTRAPSRGEGSASRPPFKLGLGPALLLASFILVGWFIGGCALGGQGIERWIVLVAGGGLGGPPLLVGLVLVGRWFFLLGGLAALAGWLGLRTGRRHPHMFKVTDAGRRSYGPSEVSGPTPDSSSDSSSSSSDSDSGGDFGGGSSGGGGASDSW